MLESLFQNMEESYEKGLQLLEQKEHEKSIKFFREKLKTGNPQAHSLAHYGLATALYQQRNIHLTREETQEVINHYEASFAQDPDFADAFFMCSIAYDHLAMTLIEEGKSNASQKKELLAKARQALTTARQHLAAATRLSPDFKKTSAKYETSYTLTEHAILAQENS